MKITNFMVRTILDPSIYESSAQPPKLFEPTKTGLALAQDYRAFISLRNRGGFGDIGCGYTEVCAMIGEGADNPTPVPLSDLPTNLHLPHGTIALDDWQFMSGRVWNGNNHVEFQPERSRRLWAKLQFRPRRVAKNVD